MKCKHGKFDPTEGCAACVADSEGIDTDYEAARADQKEVEYD